MKDVYPEELLIKDWMFVLPEDKAPKNWLDILSGLNAEILVSPLNKEEISSVGTVLKNHYHIMVLAKTRKQAQSIATMVNGTTVSPVGNLKAACRFLCNLDNPQKPQFSPDEVVALGGIDYADYI